MVIGKSPSVPRTIRKIPRDSALAGDQPHPDGEAHQAGQVLDAEPLHDLAAVGLDRLGADLEPDGDVAHAVPFAEQLEHLALAHGELLETQGRVRPRDRNAW